jgi:hypothetical protein
VEIGKNIEISNLNINNYLYLTMSRKRERANSFLDNSDKLDDKESKFDYQYYLNLINDTNTCSKFNKLKNVCKKHFFANNEVLRLQDDFYIKQSDYQNIKLSPDCFSESGDLIDVFVSNSKFGNVKINNIDSSYHDYIQIMLNILNIPRCIIYVYNIVEFDNVRDMRKSKICSKDNYGVLITDENDIYWAIQHIKKITITKDRDFNSDSINSINQKIFSVNVDEFITPRTKKVKKENFIGSDWIAASKTRNSALNDHCLDYFRAFNIRKFSDKPKKMKFSFEPSSKYERIHKEPIDASSFVDFLLISGNDFEDTVVKNIKYKFKKDFVKICESYESRNMDFFEETLEHMKKGTPIIHQAVLYNFEHKVFGSADLLVRSDYINKLTNTNLLNEDEIRIKAPLLNNYHYRVIDIKFSKIHFNSDGITMRNSNNVKPFKTQIAIYNMALGEMQGYLPDHSYILGNGWILNKTVNKRRLEESESDPFDKLGTIDYNQRDNEYYESAMDAVAWIKELNERNDFTHDPPNDPRIYPNMCNSYDGFYHSIKKEMADKYNDITNIWNCGPDNRKNAFNKNIISWKDPKCDSKTLGVKGEKTSKMIDSLLQFNRKRNKIINIGKISHNNDNWRSNDLTFYVDFETIGSMLLNSNQKTKLNVEGDYIFMVGIGWKCPNDNKWNYKCLYVNQISLAEEQRIMKEFNDIIKNLEREYRTRAKVIHWSHAEKTFYNRVNSRYGYIFDHINWYDLLKFFKDNNILILDSLNFSLKTIAKNMNKYGLIESNWEDDVSSGVDAMFYSWQEYIKFQDINSSDKFNDIIKYNEIDCKTMFEILEYLKMNH